MDFVSRKNPKSKIQNRIGGENRSRTCIGLRPVVFKTTAIPLCDLSARETTK